MAENITEVPEKKKAVFTDVKNNGKVKTCRIGRQKDL